MSERYQIIDLEKVCCAFLVVFLHVFEYNDGKILTNIIEFSIAKQAVPFFFIVSGFFMTKKMLQVENKMEYIIKYIKNTLLMYVVWTILWLPYLYNPM